MRPFDKRPLLVAIAFALAGCASAPPPQAPKIERLTGAALDARIPPPVATVSADEIVAMAKRGESAQSIVAKIDASHSHYLLGAERIAAMMREGVPAPVIDHIMEAERRRIFDDAAADIAQHDQDCQERIDQEASQCQLQLLSCWPPYTSFPYWRGF